MGSEASGVPIYAAEGYDVANLIGEGIKQAIEGGATDVAGIRAGIKTYLDSLTEEAPYVGVAKSYAFDPSTHELAATDREAFIFFYTTEPGSIRLTLMPFSFSSLRNDAANPSMPALVAT